MEPDFGSFDEVATSILREDFYRNGKPLRTLEVPSTYRVRTSEDSGSVECLDGTGGTPTKDENTKMEHEKVLEQVIKVMPQAEGLGLAEIMALSKREGGGFGEGGQGMFFLLFLLLLLGRNGGGLLGGANNDLVAQQALQNGITRADLQTIIEGLNGIKDGQVAGFSNLVNINTQGFAGLNTALNQTKFDLTSELCALGSKLQNCCCELERSIDRVSREVAESTCAIKETINGAYNSLTSQNTQNQFATERNFADVKYQAATDKAEILRAIQDNKTEVIGYMQTQETTRLREELASAKAQISQENQTTAILAALAKGNKS